MTLLSARRLEGANPFQCPRLLCRRFRPAEALVPRSRAGGLEASLLEASPAGLAQEEGANRAGGEDCRRHSLPHCPRVSAWRRKQVR